MGQAGELVAERVAKVASALSRRYRDFAHQNRKNPFEELMFILCSIQTNERLYHECFRSLMREFPRFDMLASAPEGRIARVLLRGGLSSQKARAIAGIARALKKAFGRVTLAPLKWMLARECERFLASLPGVGTKTARCVMMYSLGLPVFPVDTHCWRISRRLGWVRPTRRDRSCSPRDMDRLQELIPHSLRFGLHVNMVSLGRELCTAAEPVCRACPILRYCKRIGVIRRPARDSRMQSASAVPAHP
jgi:endonuclease III